MSKFLTALLALGFAGTAFTAPALAAGSNAPAGVFGAPVQVADRDDNENENDGDENGNGRGCYNPAGHERGRCRHNRRSDGGYYNNGGYTNYNYVRINGTVLNIHDGYVATFRRDDGQIVQVNERALLRAGTPLQPGARYQLTGYFANNGAFVVANNNNYGNPYPNNGYPGQGNATISGVVTSIHGDSVTILQGQFQSITINDQQALSNGAAQNLYVGRSVTAYGYWSGNVFYASTIG